MATTKVTCYIAVCDDCRKELETDYIVHHDSLGDAIGDAVDHDWVTVGNKFYCEWCAEGRGVSCAGCDDLVEHEGDRCRLCAGNLCMRLRASISRVVRRFRWPYS